MSYFADSAWNYLNKKVSRLRQDGGQRLLVVVPWLPEKAVLTLAETFANRCIASDVLLTLKIADVVWHSWSQESKDKAQRQNWLEDRGNLTYWRNYMSQTDKINLIVLCGVDRVTDMGSLSDFHHCDLEILWYEEMQRSFQGWIREKLKSIGIENVEATELKEFDRLLKPLMEQGKANLLSIGEWLSQLDLSPADTVRDILKLMLRHFDFFQLPNFAGFPLNRKHLSLSPYIEKANSFFSYTMFLDARERDKATKAIDQIMEVLGNGDDTGLPLHEQDVLGSYPSETALLEGLKKYIQTEDSTEQKRLKNCDFVTIIDKLFKYRKRDEPKPRTESLHKLSGGPVEVILHAVWQTFREFSRDKRFTEAQVIRIEIVPDRFKHDYENADNGEEIDATADRTELARQYLLRLIGGIDELIQERLVLPGKEGENLPVICRLADDEIPCVYAKTAEPQLEFSVKITHDGGKDPYRRKFAWRLSEIQSYRLAESLLHWAKDVFESAASTSTWKLPVFHVPYYEELLRATDEEETRRVMSHCIRDARPRDTKLTNLLGQEWLESCDPLLDPLKALSDKYEAFVLAAHTKGLHGALFSDKWTELRQAYTSCYRFVLQNPDGKDAQMTGMLLRVFLIVQHRDSQISTGWFTQSFERSGIATVLHPAVLEMLEAHILFLFSCFNAAGAIEMSRENRSKRFAESIWTSYVDLASIQSPILGLLYNEDQNLDTNVRGKDLIHRIGSPEEKDATLSTRLLVRYDSNDEEQIADTEMFRENRESKLLFRLMTDYFRLHPHARDGLNLAVFRNQDIQPVIAAVHQYLNKLADEKDRRYYVLPPERRKPYAIGVTIFTESGDDVDVARWIEQWKERWEAAETENKFQAYRRCRFSVAHRIVEARQLGAFQRLINESFESDIVVMYDFIGAGQGGNKFAEVVPFDTTTRTLKFPILEKSFCAVRHPTDRFKRSRVISNRQFTLGSLHAEIMNRLKNQGVQSDKEFVILGVGDFAPWCGVIDALHAKAEWVICIDPSMDERLIKISSGSKMQEREIIGFGSGVGSHGEANYTISTEQFSLADVQVRLAASIQEVYSSCGWTSTDCCSVANGILHEARELSGLSLVRATGVGHYIRDFMAYSLTRKMLREKDKVLCDNLVSLDAYRHWFDLADDECRPDLMWLTASLNQNNHITLKIQLIECKVAQQSEGHLRKAQQQINNGLRILISAFTPRSQDVGALREDNRPDQRYWWLQLHRLVSSKAEIENRQQADILSAMERLAEGDYEISWEASIFAFWSDDNSSEVRHIGTWKPNEREEITANIYTIGSEFVRKLAIDGTNSSMTWVEWKKLACNVDSNVCDTLEDIELPPGGDDDEDVPAWDAQDHEETEEDSTIADLPEIQEEFVFEASSEPDIASPSDLDLEDTSMADAIPDVESSSNEDKAKMNDSTSPKIPGRILLGTTIHGDKPVYWEFGHSELANRHMLIFGTSGMGKTYAIQCLLSELGRAGQNSLIIDYTDGFTDGKLEKATKSCLKPQQRYILNEPLPINPFKAQVSQEAGKPFHDTPITIAKRVACIFKSVYRLGDQQFSVLSDAVNEGISSLGDGFNLAQFLEILKGYIEDKTYTKATVRSTISKLKPFIQSNPFADDKDGIGWQNLFSDVDSRCHIFQFFKVDKDSARAVIEFVLWDLYAFVSSCGNKNIPRVVVLDEIQNLDLGPDAPVAKYLTEGRKHGLALITATQTVKGVGGVSDACVSRLFQAEHKLFFKPTENEMREHAQLLHNAINNVTVQEWASRLASLQIAECWSLGRNLNEATGRLVFQAQRIKITSLEERGFHA